MGTGWDHMGDTLRDVVTIGEGLGALGKGDFRGFGDAFVEFHRDHAADVVRDAGKVAGLLVDKAGEALRDVDNLAEDVIDKVGDFFDHLIPAVHIEAFDKFGDKAEEWVSDQVDDAQGWVEDTAETIGGAASDAAGAVVDAGGDAVGFVADNWNPTGWL